MKSFYLAVFFVLIIPFASFAQGWQDMTGYKKLNINDQVSQLVLSADGRAIFTSVINSSTKSFSLSKWDYDSGSLIWTKQIPWDTASYDKGFFISSDALSYIIFHYLKSWGYKIEVHEIESGNLLFTNTNISDQIINAPNSMDFSSAKQILMYHFKLYNTTPCEQRIGTACAFINVNNNTNLQYGYGSVQSKDFNTGLESSVSLVSWVYDCTDKYGNHTHNEGTDHGFFVRNIFQRITLFGNQISPLASAVSGDTVFAIDENNYYIFDMTKKDSLLVKYRTSYHWFDNLVRFQNGYTFLSAGRRLYVFDGTDLVPLMVLEVKNLNGYFYQLYFNSGNNEVLARFGNNVIRLSLYSKELKALFSIDNNYHIVNEAAKFTSHSTGSPETYLWDFGDGQTATGSQAVHKYQNAGSYTVRLTVTKGSASDTETRTGIIEIKDSLKAKFDYEVSSEYAPVEIKLLNKTSGSIDSLVWSITTPDSLSYKQLVLRTENPVVTVHTPGKVIVSLKAYSYPYSSLYTDTISITIKDKSLNNSIIISEYSDVSSANTGTIMALQAYQTSQGFLSFISQGKYSPSFFRLMNKDFLKLKDTVISNFHDIIPLGTDSYLVFTNWYVDTVNQSLGFSPDTLIRNRIYTNIVNMHGNYYPFYFHKIYSHNGRLDIFCLFRDSLFIHEIDNNKNISQKYMNKTLDRYHGDMGWFQIWSGEMLQAMTDFNNKFYYSLYWQYMESWYTNPNNSESHYDSLKTGNLPINDYRIIALVNLNDIMAAVSPDGIIYAIDKNENLIWTKRFGINFSYALPNGNSGFIVAGIKNDQPIIYSFDSNAQPVDSFLLENRYGGFNHISRTPDGNLLCSGYKKTANNTTIPYYVKINSNAIHGSAQNNGDNPGIVRDLINYPNPGSGPSQIFFTLLSDADISLTVFDDYGNIVSTLYKGRLTQGDHVYDFDPLPYSSGQFFYRLTVDGRDYTGGMTFTR